MAPQVYKLQKIVFAVKHQAEKFLNGITSNALDCPHSAFLNFHGKIVAVFDQLKAADDTYFIVIEDQFSDSLMRHLEMYIRLSRVVVARENFHVYFDLKGDYQKENGEYTIPQKKGQLVLTSKILSQTVSQEEFTLFRLKNNIPVHGIDFSDEMVLNVSAEDFVSFSKGCFLGQEFVAKVNSRSMPSWKLVVRAENELNGDERQAMTSKTFDPATGKTLGFVFVPNR